MRALVKLFGRSPFAPLQAHMEKVAVCVRALPPLIEAVENQQWDQVSSQADHISKLEHEADLAKNDIRANLKSNLFLPVDRVHLLNALSLQDALADQAEDVAICCTLRQLEIPPNLLVPFKEFFKKNMETFEAAYLVSAELNQLIESSFGGAEGEKMRTMVDHVAYLEHKVDLLQRPLLKTLFNSEQSLPHTAFALWVHLVREVGTISNIAEKLSNRILMTMEIK